MSIPLDPCYAPTQLRSTATYHTSPHNPFSHERCRNIPMITLEPRLFIHFVPHVITSIVYLFQIHEPFTGYFTASIDKMCLSSFFHAQPSL